MTLLRAQQGWCVVLFCFHFLTPPSPLRMTLLPEVVVCHCYREDVRYRWKIKGQRQPEAKGGERKGERSRVFDLVMRGLCDLWLLGCFFFCCVCVLMLFLL